MKQIKYFLFAAFLGIPFALAAQSSGPSNDIPGPSKNLQTKQPRTLNGTDAGTSGPSDANRTYRERTIPQPNQNRTSTTTRRPNSRVECFDANGVKTTNCNSVIDKNKEIDSGGSNTDLGQ